jgi:hypothetical protein
MTTYDTKAEMVMIWPKQSPVEIDFYFFKRTGLPFWYSQSRNNFKVSDNSTTWGYSGIQLFFINLPLTVI